MTGITDLQHLLQSMSPQLVEGDYVFCTVDGPLKDYLHLDPIATFREQEGSLWCSKLSKPNKPD